MSERRTALVLGGTGGIGEAVVRRLAESGFSVHATYHSNEARARELLSSLPDVHMVRCDLTRGPSVDTVLGGILSDTVVDVLIHCVAADLKLKPIEMLEENEILEDLETNLVSAFRVLKRVLPQMKKSRSGTILLLLSAVIEQAPPRMSSYTAAKFGLLGLMKCLEKEAGAFGIRVLGLSPSFVETDLLKPFPAKMLEIERARLEGACFLSPADVADLVMRAVVDERRFVHGAHVLVRDKKELRALLA